MPRCNALLVYPRFTPDSFWNYQATCEVVGARYSAAPLGFITLAALLPPEWDVRLVNRNTEELQDADLEWADLVMTGGMMPQQRDTLDLLALAHARGKPVAVGGPDATSSPQVYAEADFLVLGEAEGVVERLAADWDAWKRRGEYRAEGFPDLTRSPVPRFDLLKLEQYMHVGVQFSRGCPFACEFCNVIELNGRNPRVKTTEQMLRELDALYELGYRGHVDFVDDNLIGNRKALVPFLSALADWVKERNHPFEFTTEASLNLAQDDELLQLMRRANFFAVFVGIETPDPVTLARTNKRQNTRLDIAESIRKIHRAGIFVNAGFILGFDGETGRVAEAMVECIEATSIPVCMVGLLYALPGTELSRRLEKEGRLHADSDRVQREDADQCTSGLNFATKRPRDEIIEDFREVIERIYRPQAFFGRVRRLVRDLDLSEHRLRPPARLVLRDLRGFAHILWRSGVVDAEVRGEWWRSLLDCLIHNPRAAKVMVSFAALYLHFKPYSRYLTSRLQTRLGEQERPAA